MAGQQDAELQEMAEATQALARAVVEEVRELVPSPAQWARARALTEAREWVSVMFGIDAVNEPEQALETAEALALRWAALIEIGEVQGSE